MHRIAAIAFCGAVLVGAVWLSGSGEPRKKEAAGWVEVAPGILRSSSLPAGYALIDGDRALLIDAPQSEAGLKAHGVDTIDGVLLTHYHRASCAFAAEFLKKGIKVQAAKSAAPWLTPDGVKKYWKESIPLQGSFTAYLVLPVGLTGVDCSLEDGQTITWRGWSIKTVSSPGHSLSHLAYAVRSRDGKTTLFCGGALAGPGKMWAPYTTDWDHWTDKGLAPAAKSLRQLADIGADRLCPAHGPVIDKDAAAVKEALLKTADVIQENGFLKSFERFTKTRLGNAPAYAFLAREQAMTNGSKPWTKIADHLFVTGNTFVLTSKDNKCLLIDPFQKRSADQFAKLQADEKLGPLEVVMFTHAHYDHYDGIYHFPERDKFEVWMLDRASLPVKEPFRLRAPFLDARPVKIDRQPKNGSTLSWREYSFRFHYFPGQSEFTMGMETVIDGKKCFFTADNFFHQDMFSGSGGWMGLNRSWPLPYAESAEKVLTAAPDWVLAEHGGPFEFNAEDFRRRVAWGKECARAADALCLSGHHRVDWNPHRVRVEWLVQKAKRGDTLGAVLVVDPPPPGSQPVEELTITLDGRGLIADRTWKVAPADGPARYGWKIDVAETMPLGRNVFTLRAVSKSGLEPSDAFMVIDVE